jgi:hypothetical protein
MSQRPHTPASPTGSFSYHQQCDQKKTLGPAENRCSNVQKMCYHFLSLIKIRQKHVPLFVSNFIAFYLIN